MKLADCVVLVTGGSSAAWGAAVNLTAWEAGARALIADRAAPRDDNPLRLRDPQGERWLWQATDVSDEAQASAAVKPGVHAYLAAWTCWSTPRAWPPSRKCMGATARINWPRFQKVIQVNLLAVST